jgi:hypothetical protein
MWRNAGAILLGLMVGMMVNMALIELNMRVLFPIPDDMDMADPEAVEVFLATLPATGFILVIAAHLGQAFVGGWVAARLGASHPMRLALIVGAVTLAGGVSMLMMIPGPQWVVLELPFYMVVAAWAGRLEERRRAS